LDGGGDSGAARFGVAEAALDGGGSDGFAADWAGLRSVDHLAERVACVAANTDATKKR
jgi:hypothetical protein